MRSLIKRNWSDVSTAEYRFGPKAALLRVGVRRLAERGLLTDQELEALARRQT
jgi:hypothetical protein